MYWTTSQRIKAANGHDQPVWNSEVMHSKTEIQNILIWFHQTYWKGQKPLEKVRNTLWIIQIDPRAIYTVGRWTSGTAKLLLELHSLVKSTHFCLLVHEKQR